MFRQKIFVLTKNLVLPQRDVCDDGVSKKQPFHVAPVGQEGWGWRVLATALGRPPTLVQQSLPPPRVSWLSRSQDRLYVSARFTVTHLNWNNFFFKFCLLKYRLNSTCLNIYFFLVRNVIFTGSVCIYSLWRRVIISTNTVPVIVLVSIILQSLKIAYFHFFEYYVSSNLIDKNQC